MPRQDRPNVGSLAAKTTTKALQHSTAANTPQTWLMQPQQGEDDEKEEKHRPACSSGKGSEEEAQATETAGAHAGKPGKRGGRCFSLQQHNTALTRSSQPPAATAIDGLLDVRNIDSGRRCCCRVGVGRRSGGAHGGGQR
jgi:hypothetical protein